mgnify:FL=1
MKAKELIEILQQHSPNQEIILLNDRNMYTIDSKCKLLFGRKYLKDRAKKMKVKELIDELENYPEDKTIICRIVGNDEYIIECVQVKPPITTLNHRTPTLILRKTN